MFAPWLYEGKEEEKVKFTKRGLGGCMTNFRFRDASGRTMARLYLETMERQNWYIDDNITMLFSCINLPTFSPLISLGS